jgi:putative CocE/NonD family hydrolase
MPLCEQLSWYRRHVPRVALVAAALISVSVAGCVSSSGPGVPVSSNAPVPALSPDRISAPGRYSGYSELRYSEYSLVSRYVEMRDGTRLAVDIFRPAVNGTAVDGQFPLVWMHTPYSRARITTDGERQSILERGDSGFLHLVNYGYIVAVVDTRGRGASFGVRRGFLDRTEAQDAYDMTEWFAAQPWSDGNIGLAGCSYNGASTLHAATTAPPHLKAIAPGCFAFDSYRFVARGGIPAQFNTRPEDPQIDYGYGVAPVDEDQDGSMAAAAIEMHYDGTPMAELWRGMPHRDDVSPLLDTDFWRETSAATYIATLEKSGVGIFMWGNWLDEGSFQQTLAFNNLSNPRKLWMGGWGHCQVGDFPMKTELLRFFDFYLKGIDNGWEDEAPVYYYTIGAPAGQEWSSASSWPPASATAQTLLLDGDARPETDGRLVSERIDNPGIVGEFTVDYSPECVDSTIDPYFLFRPCVVAGSSITFDTPILVDDLHVLGHPLVDLQVSFSTPDADLFAYLEIVEPSGDVSVMTHGRLRASHRKESEPPLDYMGIPYHSGLKVDVEPVVPGDIARLRFDLLPTSTIVKAGSRLRLRLAGADPRQRFRTIQFDPPTVVTLRQGKSGVSSLQLPLASD